MRNVTTATVVVLVGLLQFTYPAVLAPLHVVPDLVLLFVLCLALYYRPTTAVLWWAGLAGLVVDLWQPSHFGTWTLACLVVAGLTLTVHTRVLPRLTQAGAFVTAAIALAAGVLVLAFVNAWGAPLGAGFAALGRTFLLKYIFDLALTVPLLAIAKRVAVALRGGSGTKIVVRV
ncbi:MAG: rod shape-determining protein MreD [Candidatus Andersenbacteria bacterium]